MTMFSMKPKFDLAAFLAVPAPKGSRTSRGARSRGVQFRSQATSGEAVKTEQPEDPGKAD